MDEFVVEFQRLVVMIHHILEKWITFLFIKGLYEPLRGMVKVSHPRTMDNAIRAAYDLEPTVKSLRGGSANKALPNRKLLEGHSKAKTPALSRSNQFDAATRKLRERGRCFHCKKPWEPGHHCLGKGHVHFIEVFSEDSS